MVQGGQRRSFAGECGTRPVVVDEGRAEDLRDDRGMQPVVPDDVCLVPVATAEHRQDTATGDEVVARAQTPGRGRLKQRVRLDHHRPIIGAEPEAGLGA
jgi:hypothetical protein